MSDSTVLERAERFMATQARALDQRLFQHRFQDGSAEPVLAALKAYRNADGGFGHGLEPDLRTPASQPIHAEIALQVMREAGLEAPELVDGLCDWLETVTDEAGAVAPTLPGASDWPCAMHWTILEWALAPGINPTASIAGHLEAMGASHPWLDRVAAWCRADAAEQTYTSAHSLRAALLLVAGDDALRTRMIDQLAGAEWWQPDAPITTYGVTPLHLAPEPDHPCAAHFGEVVLNAHLDDLLSRQQEDGGWPIHWEPPGPAALAAWRGRWTLDALLTLRAYGRI